MEYLIGLILFSGRRWFCRVRPRELTDGGSIYGARIEWRKGIRSRIKLALVSYKMRWRPKNRYWMSSGSVGNTARTLGGTVERGFFVRVGAVNSDRKFPGCRP